MMGNIRAMEGVEGLGREQSSQDAGYPGAYGVNTESRDIMAWQGAQVLSCASVPGLPSFSECAYLHLPVAAYFLESLTISNPRSGSARVWWWCLRLESEPLFLHPPFAMGIKAKR
jgi:hypothetical protein